MITFFLNQMGVYNNIPTTRVNRTLGKELTVKEGDKHYACGRVDIYNVPDEPCGLEYSIGIMEQESWCKFGDYLSTLKVTFLPCKQTLIDMFESATGHKIKWYREEELVVPAILALQKQVEYLHRQLEAMRNRFESATEHKIKWYREEEL
jgi:hypothetical protein